MLSDSKMETYHYRQCLGHLLPPCYSRVLMGRSRQWLPDLVLSSTGLALSSVVELQAQCPTEDTSKPGDDISATMLRGRAYTVQYHPVALMSTITPLHDITYRCAVF